MTAGLLSGAATAAAVASAGRGRRGRARLRLAGVWGDTAGSPGSPQPGHRPTDVAMAAACCGGVAAAALAGWLAGMAVAVGLAGAGAAWQRLRVLRRHRRLSRAVPDVAVALAAELRAGAAPPAALLAVASSGTPLASALRAAAARSQGGSSAGRALRDTAAAVDVPELGWVGSAFEALETSGAAVAGVLDRLGEALDARAAAAERLRAHLAGPRATAVLLTGLPLLGVGLGQVSGANPLALLVGRPAGWVLGGAAAVLDATGLWWSRRIVKGVSGPRTAEPP